MSAPRAKRPRRGFLAIGGGVALLWGWSLGCRTEALPPGDEIIGTFNFVAEPPAGECALTEIPLDAGLTFQASLSLSSEGNRGWLTLGGVTREGSWDGRRFQSRFRARRVFAGCQCTVALEETFDVVLLSRSQNDALQGVCPENPFDLDGGIPAPTGGPDGGIQAPGPSASGFDAVRACGLLTDELIVPEGDCTCPGACRLVYPAVGVRL